MRRDLLLLPFACAFLVGAGCDDATSPPDTGVVRGTVTRIYTSDGLAGATVSVGDETVACDRAGAYQLNAVPRGRRTLSVTAPGYREHREVVLVGEWQTVDVALTPRDSIVTIAGNVRHALDGPVAATLMLPDREVVTDEDGAWRAVDVPLGPLPVVIDEAPYNRFDAPLLVQYPDQVLDIVLTRDVTVIEDVDQDAYVFMQDDSLNANRGQVEALWISAELGRTAVFGMPRPGGAWAGAPIVGATLHLRGSLAPGEECPGPASLALRVSRLTGPVNENAIDHYQRPRFEPVDVDTVTFDANPQQQSLAVDVTSVYLTQAEVGGVALGALFDPPCLIRVASSEHGDPALRPRLAFVLRY
jgi:hypothetical protein